MVTKHPTTILLRGRLTLLAESAESSKLASFSVMADRSGTCQLSFFGDASPELYDDRWNCIILFLLESNPFGEGGTAGGAEACLALCDFWMSVLVC